jgi:hypothetical protein
VAYDNISQTEFRLFRISTKIPYLKSDCLLCEILKLELFKDLERIISNRPIFHSWCSLVVGTIRLGLNIFTSIYVRGVILFLLNGTGRFLVPVTTQLPSNEIREYNKLSRAREVISTAHCQWDGTNNNQSPSTGDCEEICQMICLPYS